MKGFLFFSHHRKSIRRPGLICLDMAARQNAFRSQGAASGWRRTPTGQEDNVEKLRIKPVLLIVALSALTASASPISAQRNKQSVKADTLTGYQETPSTLASTGTGTFT